jgi:hypothetical protein
MSPRADCSDCAWSFKADDHVVVADELEEHARKEQHHVDFQRVATDGGEEVKGLSMDGVEIAEFHELAEERCQGFGILDEPQDVDLTLVELSASYLDPDGILRTFSITADGFDPADYEHQGTEEKDPEIETDGGREMVYVTTRKYDAKKPFHTDPDCHHLEKAVSDRSVPREALNDGYKECDHCAGEIDKPAGVGEGHLDSLKTAAEDGPDIATDGGIPDPLNFEAAVNDALHEANDPESHVERDARTFHPSQIARCPRRAYCSKLGLDDQSDILGVFQTGTLIHEFLEEHMADRFAKCEFEHPVEYEADGIRFTGRTDCYDPAANAVYDFKTRASWYNFDPPTQRHLDQMYVYMAALGADRGQVVYLSKSDMGVRTWPEDGFFEFDRGRFDQLVEKAQRIKAAIDVDGLPETVDDIPFERCGCYFCEEENLVDGLGGEAGDE